MESLSEKLKSLGVQIGAQGLESPQPKREFRVEEVIEGHDVETNLGRVFVVDNILKQGYEHGVIQLCANHRHETLAIMGNNEAFSRLDRQNIVFIDAETTSLAGGAGTFAFMVGLGFYEQDNFRVIQLFLRDPSEELAFLSVLGSYIERFNGVVSYNGKSFDIPLLNNRHVIHSLPSPFTQTSHLDLLHMARKLWRNRLTSRSLKDIEVEILHTSRTIDEVPGWLVPQIYFDYLQSGDARPLAGVFYHNRMDIVSLAALYVYLCGILNEPLTNPLTHFLDLIEIGSLYEQMGNSERAVKLYEQCLQNGLPRQSFLNVLLKYAFLYRKKGDWLTALPFWEKAAELQHVDSCIELAKYYEHHERDIVSALTWTEHALTNLASLDITKSSKKLLEKNLEHRHARLSRKSEKQPQGK